MMRYIVLAGILFCTLNTFAADSTEVKNRSFELYEWGMTFGYGFVNQDIPEGNYGPFLLGGNIEFHAHRKSRKPSSHHYILLFAEPQVNPVLLGGGIKEWEAGCNIGLKYLISVKEKNSIYFHGGSGPHYISLDDPFGGSGFGFASNVGMGYARLFKRDVKITMGYRFRQLSNLSKGTPYDAIQNHFFTMGFTKGFQNRVQQRRERKGAGLQEE